MIALIVRNHQERVLRSAGWRKGPRDGRWRHDDFGGAYKTENAYRRHRRNLAAKSG